MKITKSQLKRIIQEELQQVMMEQDREARWARAGRDQHRSGGPSSDSGERVIGMPTTPGGAPGYDVGPYGTGEPSEISTSEDPFERGAIKQAEAGMGSGGAAGRQGRKAHHSSLQTRRQTSGPDLTGTAMKESLIDELTEAVLAKLTRK